MSKAAEDLYIHEAVVIEGVTHTITARPLSQDIPGSVTEDLYYGPDNTRAQADTNLGEIAPLNTGGWAGWYLGAKYTSPTRRGILTQLLLNYLARKGAYTKSFAWTNILTAPGKPRRHQG